MSNGAAIFVLLLGASCVSAFAHVIFDKNNRGRKWFFALTCYYLSFSFIMSVVKYVLGYHNENLLESFWDLQAITLVHYGVPLFIMALVLPIFAHLVFKGREYAVIRYFDSVLFFCVAFMFFIARVVNNGSYIVAFAIALFITVLSVIFKRIDKVEYIFEGGIDKTSIKKIMIMTVYWFVTVAIYNPNELYLSNADEFPMSYWYFFGKLLAGSIVILLVIIAGETLYLTKVQLDAFSMALFILVTLGYIQGMFLNGKMESLDGTNAASDLFKMVINLAIWFAIVAAILALYKVKKGTAERFANIIAIWITLIQIVSLVTVIIISDDTATKSATALTTKGRLDVGEENNIIMFVLDKYDGRIIDEILEDDADFLEPLHDFTYYRNITSEFSLTNSAVPYLISGTDYDEDSNEDYVEYAYDTDNMINDLYNAGYEIGIYTDKNYVSENMKDYIINYEDGVVRTCGTYDLVELMLQCSRYKMAPLIEKDYYVYSTSDVSNLAANDTVVNIENDLPFYNSLLDEGVSVDESNSKGTFRFIHMYGAHPPYTMTSDFQYKPFDGKRDVHYGSDMLSQAEGSMKIVYEYISQLKELGKYEDATIIITADHGHNTGLYDDEGNITDISVPILFVKKPGESSDVIKKSNAPISHEDLMPTIEKAAGIAGDEITIDDISEDEERTRIFRICKDEIYRKYEITGDVYDINNWKLVFER
jgi:hypothetical protein